MLGSTLVLNVSQSLAKTRPRPTDHLNRVCMSLVVCNIIIENGKIAGTTDDSWHMTSPLDGFRARTKAYGNPEALRGTYLAGGMDMCVVDQVILLEDADV